jgi:dynein heavy chain
VRLWIHECERVFRDRLVSDADAAKFDEFRAAATRKYFEELPGGMAALEERPLLFTSFVQARSSCRTQGAASGYMVLRRGPCIAIRLSWFTMA